MEIRYNGRYVKVKTQDDWDEFNQLRCTCGHLATDHEYQFAPGSSDTIEVGACLRSYHCRQFKIKGKPEPLNLYAQENVSS